ncbi:MAG TPA: 7-cyano-7-deazaguanine synthase QueC [Parachlamydiaceae bacterium]|nr:7-cyano-7-deazaguanine synthase QueC [Parachlamydiaceae bacterium]
MKKDAVVVHSGGMDSSICLKLALDEFQKENVLSLSFSYNQKHSNEIIQAAKIADHFCVDHVVINIDALSEITENALTNHSMTILKAENASPNTLVVGRNGLMARIAAIHANHLQASCIFMGVIEVEAANSGYRDCSRAYMDLMEQILRIDLDDPKFTIRTPLVLMTKKETMALADSLGVLDYLLEETITCYNGIRHMGCKDCPACKLRNEGLLAYTNSKK